MEADDAVRGHRTRLSPGGSNHDGHQHGMAKEGEVWGRWGRKGVEGWGRWQVGGEGEEADQFGETRVMATGEGDGEYWLRQDLDDEPLRWAGHIEGHKSAFTLRIESKFKYITQGGGRRERERLLESLRAKQVALTYVPPFVLVGALPVSASVFAQFCKHWPCLILADPGLPGYANGYAYRPGGTGQQARRKQHRGVQVPPKSCYISVHARVVSRRPSLACLLTYALPL